jgi:hypothetical protein
MELRKALLTRQMDTEIDQTPQRVEFVDGMHFE